MTLPEPTTAPTATLPPLPAPDAVPAHLLDRLADHARSEGLVDVAYRTVDSPLGRLLVAQTEAGVVRVAFEDEGEDAVLDDLGRRVGPRVLAAPRRLDPVARALDGYFTGVRHAIDVPVDLRLLTGFRRSVVELLPTIGYGETTTYGELARRAGREGAARAVGTACGSNPVPVVVPCHRVLPAAGGVGGYRGGAEAKAALLALERTHRDD